MDDVSREAARKLRGALAFWNHDPSRHCRDKFIVVSGEEITKRCMNSAITGQRSVFVGDLDPSSRSALVMVLALAGIPDAGALLDHQIIRHVCEFNNLAEFNNIIHVIDLAAATLENS